eukprot:11181860-Lingulodinium_polyedra.AAC.1
MASRRFGHFGGDAPGRFPFVEGEIVAPSTVGLGAPGPRVVWRATGRRLSRRPSDHSSPGTRAPQVGAALLSGHGLC